MPFKMVVNQLHLGDEGEAYIHGLGSFTNGEHEISDEAEHHFRVVHTFDAGGLDDDPASDTFGSYIPDWKEGPDLVTASESMHGITVTRVKEAPKAGSGQQRGAVESTSSGPGEGE